MSIQDPFEQKLESKFQNEQLKRTIEECEDLFTLKQIALELLKLNQTKTAVANWVTKRAFESEKLYDGSNIYKIN